MNIGDMINITKEFEEYCLCHGNLDCTECNNYENEKQCSNTPCSCMNNKGEICDLYSEGEHNGVCFLKYVSIYYNITPKYLC